MGQDQISQWIEKFSYLTKCSPTPALPQWDNQPLASLLA